MADASGSFDEPVIAGPFHLFDGSFILEFLEPHPSRNASVLMRAVYKHDHPLCNKGKGHPQSPRFHLHMEQSEASQVLAGRVGTTNGYSCTDTIWTPADPPRDIPAWQPHTFWPVPNSTEDCVLLVWAYPKNVPDAMDRLYFTSLLRYVSDVHEGKASMDVLQHMLIHDASATTLVWFPTAWFLGPLRWWIPCKIQAVLAAIAKLSGRLPLMEKYVTKKEWEDYRRPKTE